MFAESQGAYLPDCLNGRGCRIGEDIALDPYVQKTIENYLLAKYLPGAQNSEHIFNALLKEVGLLDDVPLFVELEKIFYTHRKPGVESLSKFRA